MAIAHAVAGAVITAAVAAALTVAWRQPHPHADRDRTHRSQRPSQSQQQQQQRSPNYSLALERSLEKARELTLAQSRSLDRLSQVLLENQEAQLEQDRSSGDDGGRDREGEVVNKLRTKLRIVAGMISDEFDRVCERQLVDIGGYPEPIRLFNTVIERFVYRAFTEYLDCFFVDSVQAVYAKLLDSVGMAVAMNNSADLEGTPGATSKPESKPVNEHHRSAYISIDDIISELKTANTTVNTEDWVIEVLESDQGYCHFLFAMRERLWLLQASLDHWLS